ncbi:MAG TPA: SpoIIE family protein phosphatase [Gemmatimonadales bacterium]
MTDAGFALGPSQTETLFPFHLIWDDDLRITQVGPSLQRLFPDLLAGAHLLEHFRIDRPHGISDAASLRAHPHRVFILEHTQSKVVLRGEVVPVGPPPGLAFLGSPWLRDPSDLAKLGLRLGDFAGHDATVDMLQLLQTTATALKDTQRLADRLDERSRELRQANEALRASETRYRTLLEQSPLGILTMALDGDVTFANRRLVEALGGRPEDVLGQAWRRLFPLGLADAALAELLRVGTGQSSLNIELPLRRPDGSTGWVSLTGAVLADAQGNPEGFLVIAEDITSRKDAEAAMARARDLELQVASRIQETLLHGRAPKTLPGLTVGEFIQSHTGVNGDFHDYYVHTPGVIDVLLGDAMGKGLPAALLGAATKARCARVVGRLIFEGRGRLPEPRDIVARLQRSLGPQLVAMESFVTMVYLRLDLTEGTITWVDCGHPGLLRLRRDSGEVELLKGDNAPLGFGASQSFSQEVTRFFPGEVLVVFSDGLTEQRNSVGEMFGTARLAAVVQAAADAPPDAMAMGIRDALSRFGDVSFGDDVSCLVLSANPLRLTEPHCIAETFPASPSSLVGIRRFVRRFLATAVPGDAPAEWEETLLLAVHEVATNVLNHGLEPGTAGTTLNVAVGSTPEGVQVLITYEGRPFTPPETVTLPDLAEFPDHGFGLGLIAGATDGADYGTDAEGRRTITLTKRFPRPASSAGPHP